MPKNEFGDGMAGFCTRDLGITADLNRQIDKRNHDADRADDLSEIGQVIEIHVSEPLAVVGQSLRLPNQKAATDAVALQFISPLSWRSYSALS
jgi:hypothetical protein